MPNEYVNVRNHDAGWFRFDWKYSTDQSVDLAADKLKAVARDGIDDQEVLEFIKSGADFDQISDREARQISAVLRQNYGQMSQEAQKIAEKFDAALQDRVDNLHDSSDERLSGFDHDIFGVGGRRGDPDAVVLANDDLNSLIFDLDNLARPR